MTIKFFKTCLFVTTLFFSNPGNAQLSPSSDLYRALKTKDSLLFEVGYNTCDISQFEQLISDHFEFYHDKSGITGSKADFITSIKDGLCKMDYKARRELVPGSIAVYPLSKDGIIYGAIQMGKHRFYALRGNKPKQLTSEAQFTHLWLLEDGAWKLSKGLSYDHREAGK